MTRIFFIILFFISYVKAQGPTNVIVDSFLTSATNTLNNADFYVQTSLGTNTPYQVLTISGLIGPLSATNTRNTVDLRATGVVWNPPTAVGAVSVISSSASDAAAGVGCQTVTVTGIDASDVEQTATATMNGVTSVNVVPASNWKFINSITCTAVGSTFRNVGYISARITAVTQMTMGLYGSGLGATFGTSIGNGAMYYVPAATTISIKYVKAVSTRFGAAVSTACAVFLFYKETNAASSPIIQWDTLGLENDGQSTAIAEYALSRNFVTGNIIWAEAACGTATTQNVAVLMSGIKY